MATVEIIELIKPETGEKFYPYAHLNGVKGAELLPRIGSSVQTTLPTPIFQIKDALNAQFYPQTHADAVIGLAEMIESNQFFEKESDGNGGFRIRLKDEFTGLYADGWVATGGIGQGGSGGSGLITSVKGIADLGLSDHRWSNIYGVNANLTGDLALASTSHIDIGPARIEYDATNGAIHVTTNQTGNNAPTIGFYADGFSASGGIGNGGGGGGYGVEQITTNEDGTIDFHFTGGDITTVDLNHEHPQYPKYVQCTQAEYDALTTKESDTLYLIPATA